ncbi:hypothetical protein [Actinoplanes sp. NPDC048796]
MDTRNELREFLASRRARIRPQDAGLPAGSGRGFPGCAAKSWPPWPA